MKRYILFSLLFVFSAAAPAAAQTPAQNQLIVERIQNGWMIAPDARVADLDGRVGSLAGVYGGRLHDRKLLFGAGGYWLTNRDHDFKLAYGGRCAIVLSTACNTFATFLPLNWVRGSSMKRRKLQSPHDPSRRALLQALVALPAVGLVACGDGDSLADLSPTAPTTTTTTTTTTPSLPVTPACADDDDDPTPAQTEGPYFKPSSPLRSSLLESGMAGTRLVITGQVLTTSCTPIASALLDFWQADNGGNYDNSGYVCADISSPTQTADSRSRRSCPASIRAAPGTFTSKCSGPTVQF